MKPEIVLGLDLGKTTGWASAVPTVPTGVFAWTNSFDGSKGEIYHAFWGEFVVTASSGEAPQLVAYERPAFNRGFTYIPGLEAILLALCEEFKYPYTSVTVQQIKMIATGKGNATKAEVIQAAKDKWGLDLNEHEADALWCRQWALENVEL